MTINLENVSREEIKAAIAEAIAIGDMVAAKVRFHILDEIIGEEGFRSIDEINEYYTIKKFINDNL